MAMAISTWSLSTTYLTYQLEPSTSPDSSVGRAFFHWYSPRRPGFNPSLVICYVLTSLPKHHLGKWKIPNWVPAEARPLQNWVDPSTLVGHKTGPATTEPPEEWAMAVENPRAATMPHPVWSIKMTRLGIEPGLLDYTSRLTNGAIRFTGSSW